MAALAWSMYGALHYQYIEVNKQHNVKCAKENYEGHIKSTKESVRIYMVEGKLAKYVPKNKP